MSFPFDGSFKNLMSGFAASRAMRRAAKRRQRLLQRKHAGYKFEALEPRILLSADPLTVSLAQQISTVEIEHTSTTETQIRVTPDGGTTSTSIIDNTKNGLLLQGTASDDTVTVVWVESEHIRENFSVTIDAGQGSDVVTLNSAAAGEVWKVQALTVSAEEINLDADARVEAVDNIHFEASSSTSTSAVKNSQIDLQGDLLSSAGDVVVRALSEWTFSGVAPAASFVQSAIINVFGEISALARDIDISAVARAALSLTETSDLLMPVGNAQNAAVIIHGAAELSGGQVKLLSETDFDLIAHTTPSLAGSTIEVDLEQQRSRSLAQAPT